MPRMMESPRARKRKKAAPNPLVGLSVGATTTVAKPKKPAANPLLLAQRKQRIKTDPYLKKTAVKISRLANAYKSDPRDPAGQIISQALKDGTMRRYDREIRYGGNSARKKLEADARAAGLQPDDVTIRAASILNSVRVEKTYNPVTAAEQAVLMAKPSKTGKNPLKILQNAGLEGTQALVGMMGAGEMLVRHPVGTVKAVGKDYAYRYGPIIKDPTSGKAWRKVAAIAAKRPLSYGFDAAAVAGLAGKGAQLGGLAKMKPRVLRDVTVGKDAEGNVTRAVSRERPHGSPAIVSRAVQHKFDRFSEKLSQKTSRELVKDAVSPTPAGHLARTKLRVLTAVEKRVGAGPRVNRIGRKVEARERGRGYAESEPFVAVASELKKPELIAHGLLKSFAGGKDVFAPENIAHTLRRVDQEIERLRQVGTPEAARLEANPENVRAAQQARATRDTAPARAEAISQLKQGREVLVSAGKDPKVRARLEASYAAGRKLSRHDTAVKLRAGLITREQAREIPNMASRIASGGKVVEIPARTKSLVYQEKQIGRFEKKIGKMRAKVEERQRGMIEKSGGSAAAEEARLAEAQKTLDEYVVKVHDKRYGKTLSPESNKLQRHRNTVNGILAKGPGKKGYARAQREAATWGTGNVHLENMRNAEDAAMAALEKAAKTDPKAAAFLRDVETLNARKLADKSTPFDVTPTAKAEAPKLPLQKGFGRGQMIGPHPAGGGRILYPKGMANLERYTSALSVAKEQIARSAEKQAGRADRPIVRTIGGEPSPGAYYGKVVTRGSRTARKYQSTSTAFGKNPASKQSKGILLTQGRADFGPAGEVIAHNELVRFQSHVGEIEKLVKTGLKPDPRFGETGLRPGYTWIDPEAATSPATKRMLAELEHSDLPAVERRAVLKAGYDELEQALAPGEIAGAKNRMVQVRTDHVERLLAGRPMGGAKTSQVVRAIDAANNFARVGYVFGKFSYIPLNFGGNVVFGSIQQGPWLVKNMAAVKRLAPEVQAQILHEVGQGGARSLSAPAGGWTAQQINRLIGFQGKHADNWTRSASFVHEAAARGYKGEARIRELLTSKNSKTRADLNEVSQEAENMAVDFSTTPAEKAVVGRAVFIYPWMKGATRYVLTLPRDHPIRVAFLHELGTLGDKRSKKRLGQLQKYMEQAGLIPVGKPNTVGGKVLQSVINPIAITPLGTGAQSGQLANDILQGKSAKESSGSLFGLAQPVIRAGIEAGTGRNITTGREYKGGLVQSFAESLLGTPEAPGLAMARAAKKALEPGAVLPKWAPFGLGKIRSPGLLKAPDKSKSKYVEGTGPWAAVVDAAAGSVRTHTLNKTLANEQGQSEFWGTLSRADKTKAQNSAEFKTFETVIAHAYGKKTGLSDDATWALKTRGAVRERISEAREQASPEQLSDGGKLTPQTVLAVKMKMLNGVGIIPDGRLPEALAYAAKATDTDATKMSRGYDSDYLGADIIAKMGRTLRKQGYNIHLQAIQ